MLLPCILSWTFALGVAPASASVGVALGNCLSQQGQAVVGAQYREDLRVLSGPRMAGRAAGSPGDRQVLDYLEQRFTRLGLRPAVGDSLLQPFALGPLPGSGFVGQSRLSLGAPEVDGGLSWRQAAIGRQACSFPFSADGQADAEVAFCGHGLVVSELGIDDYRGHEVRNKVVLVLRGASPGLRRKLQDRRRSAVWQFEAKAREAKRRGAVALLVVERSDGQRGSLTPEVVARARGARVLPVFWLDREFAAPLFSGGMVGLLRAEREVDRGRPAPALLAGQRAAFAVARKAEVPRRTANLLGLHPGGDDRVGREILVVGAHHDHIGHGEFASLADLDERGLLHPGADDNASGVAALLELARRWRVRGGGRRSVLFAAFGAEELGQRGSRWLLAHLPSRGRVVGMIDLNMIGRAASQPLTVYGADTGSGLRRLVTDAVSAETRLQVQLRHRTSYRSDQWVFASAGIPALLLTTGLHEQYHRPGDVPELVEVEAALQVVDLTERLLVALDRSPRLSFAAPAGR
ncbi:MAG: M20/M25/M40 family metallo-hydrolase [Planctomycetota bacterium]|nr:M20/M25/M40 family metallo-hydrolase [Planctomycetota bacterium]